MGNYSYDKKRILRIQRQSRELIIPLAYKCDPPPAAISNTSGRKARRLGLRWGLDQVHFLPRLFLAHALQSPAATALVRMYRTQSVLNAARPTDTLRRLPKHVRGKRPRRQGGGRLDGQAGDP